MPSPVGHALGGFIAGWLVAGSVAQASRLRRRSDTDSDTDPVAPACRPVAAACRPVAAACRPVAPACRPVTPASRVLGDRVRRAPRLCGGIGTAANLDLVLGRHSQFTHSIGATLIVLVLALWLLFAAGHAQSSWHSARRPPMPPIPCWTGWRRTPRRHVVSRLSGRSAASTTSRTRTCSGVSRVSPGDRASSGMTCCPSSANCSCSSPSRWGPGGCVVDRRRALGSWLLADSAVWAEATPGRRCNARNRRGGGAKQRDGVTCSNRSVLPA